MIHNGRWIQFHSIARVNCNARAMTCALIVVELMACSLVQLDQIGTQIGGAACRCDIARQRSGSCCCRTSVSSPVAMPACCSLSKSSASAPSSTGQVSVFAEEEHKQTDQVTLCHCDNAPPEEMGFHFAPRLTTGVTTISPVHVQTGLLRWPGNSHQSCVFPPETPPPEVCAVAASVL